MVSCIIVALFFIFILNFWSTIPWVLGIWTNWLCFLNYSLCMWRKRFWQPLFHNSSEWLFSFWMNSILNLCWGTLPDWHISMLFIAREMFVIWFTFFFLLQIWFGNVPSTKLVEYKKDQNWVRISGDYLVFPGGGTQFKEGVTNYIDFIEKVVYEFPLLNWLSLSFENKVVCIPSNLCMHWMPNFISYQVEVES